MKTYIHRDIRNVYEFENALNESVPTGTTYEDYKAGRWIELSDEQLAFRAEHADASWKEIIEMRLEPPIPPEQSLDERVERLIGLSIGRKMDGLNDVLHVLLNDISPSLSDDAVRRLPETVFDSYDAGAEYEAGRVVTVDGVPTRVLSQDNDTAELQDVFTGSVVTDARRREPNVVTIDESGTGDDGGRDAREISEVEPARRV